MGDLFEGEGLFEMGGGGGLNRGFTVYFFFSNSLKAFIPQRESRLMTFTNYIFL